MKKKKANWLVILLITIFLITLFLFFRLYKIQTSLLFAVDMGRDFLTLRQWWEKGTPPLLGPQTSTIPFNQSALYFYLLYPLFLITKHSPFSTVYTCCLIYTVSFALGVYLLRKKPVWLKSLFTTWLLLSFQPQFIIQHRFVWNPSLVAPFLIASFYFYAQLQEKFSTKTLILFSLSLATAVSLSFSVAPVLIAYVLLTLFKNKKKILPIIFSLAASLFVLNLPTLFFELRHNFTLTNLMLNYPRVEQEQTALTIRLQKLFNYTVSPQSLSWTGILLLIIIATAVILFLKTKNKNKQVLESQKLLTQATWLLSLTFFFTFIIPWDLQPHFIFGILTLGLIIVSLLPCQTLIPIVLLTLAIWLRPNQIKGYFQPTFRSVKETQACAKMVCETEKQPMFLTIQSGVFPYHTGQAFRFLFKEAGCEIKIIETKPQEAQRMAVIVEKSQYNHGKTNYWELTLFGQSKEIEKYECLNGLQVHILEKIPNE